MGMFNSTPEPVREAPQEQKSQRHMLILVPAIIGFIAGGFLTGNPLAGGLVGLAFGLAFHGVSQMEAIRGDEFARRRVYRRPLWYRVSVAAVALGGALLWLTGIRGVELPEFITRLYQVIDGGAMAAAIGTIVLAVAFALWGKWRSLASGTKSRISNGAAQRAAKTDDEKALLAFSENTLRQAGLGVTSTVAHEEILPKILSKKIDEKGRAVVSIAVIPGRQTFQDIVKASERIATAWQIPRVVVSAGSPLKDGGHTVRIMAVLSESLVPALIPWEPLDTSVPVVEYVQNLGMGAFTQSADPWILDISSRNFIIGGQPGSGKSSFSNALVAHLLRHPDIRVHYIDLKNGADSELWADGINGTTHNGTGGAGVEGALAFIQRARQDLKGRYDRMRNAGKNNAWTQGVLGPDEPVKVLIIDETSELFRRSTKAERETTEALIEDLKSFIQQGRAAGYILLMATQFPITENLPSAIRTVASDALAFRMRSNGVSATLGPDFVWKDYNDPTRSGIGEAVIRSIDVDGERIKMAFLTDEDRKRVIAESAIAGRSWFTDGDDYYEEEEPEAPLPDGDDGDFADFGEPAVYPRPVAQRPRPVWRE